LHPEIGRGKPLEAKDYLVHQIQADQIMLAYLKANPIKALNPIKNNDSPVCIHMDDAKSPL
jgi:hypothetical protein